LVCLPKNGPPDLLARRFWIKLDEGRVSQHKADPLFRWTGTKAG